MAENRKSSTTTRLMSKTGSVPRFGPIRLNWASPRRIRPKPADVHRNVDRMSQTLDTFLKVTQLWSMFAKLGAFWLSCSKLWLNFGQRLPIAAEFRQLRPDFAEVVRTGANFTPTLCMGPLLLFSGICSARSFSSRFQDGCSSARAQLAWGYRGSVNEDWRHGPVPAQRRLPREDWRQLRHLSPSSDVRGAMPERTCMSTRSRGDQSSWPPRRSEVEEAEGLAEG